MFARFIHRGEHSQKNNDMYHSFPLLLFVVVVVVVVVLLNVLSEVTFML